MNKACWMLLWAGLATGLVACEDRSDLEQAGERLEQKARETGDAVKERMKEAGEKGRKKVREAGEAVSDLIHGD